MRTLASNDIYYVSGGNTSSFLNHCYYAGLNFGANGALFYVLMQGGATLPVVGYGFACGAVVGALYATMLELFPEPF